MDSRKSKKTVLVCGASEGIGRAAALRFAEAGWNVIALARNAEKLNQLLPLLNTAQAQEHHVWVQDLSELNDLHEMAQKMAQKYSIDCVVNNSGGPKGGPLLEANAEALIAAFSQHILAAQILAQAFVPKMQQKKFGRIINVISTSVKTPLANLGVSNTIRGAMASWAKTLANELGANGITVNSVLPGYTSTGRLDALLEADMKRSEQSRPEVEARWQASIPAKRFASASEIAEAIVFLASEAAGYINGVALPVDGGRTPSL